jgi:hypothetical protein
MHISDKASRPAINASDGLAEPIEIEVVVADCNPEPVWAAAMAARTPTGEKVLKPMGLDACRCFSKAGQPFKQRSNFAYDLPPSVKDVEDSSAVRQPVPAVEVSICSTIVVQLQACCLCRAPRPSR